MPSNLHWFYRGLLRVRPSQLASFLKVALRIRRRAVTETSGLRFWIDPVSHFGGEVLETGTYEPDLANLIRGILRPGDTFIDVGANEGFFTVLGSRLVGPAGRVVAVEPQSRLRPILDENLRLNGCGNVHVLHEALAEKAGEMTLHLTSSVNSGAGSFYKHWRFGSGTEKVRTRTFDQMLASESVGRVRLVKMDCEGAELSVILGAIQLLKEKRAEFLSIDFHPNIVGEKNSFQIDRLLREAGYLLTRTGTSSWVYHLPGLENVLLPLGPMKSIPPLAA